MEKKTLKYTIDESDMPAIFGLLRTKIYSDVIGSICREIASNSRDANREVGNKNPIEISIEVLNSTTYVIFKDNGPGISTDRMENVFCKYIASSKRTDSNQTGGFGLGAKTPFAYTDKFNVITNVNGKKYSYICALDNDNGSIKLIKEEKTKDANGTEIQIPIKNYEDIQNFERKIVYFTQFWTPQPVLKNFISYSYENVVYSDKYGNDKIKILTTPTSYGELLALVDGIPYKVDVSKVNINHNKLLYGKTIVFNYKKEDVSVSANRETLYFNEETSKTIYQNFIDAQTLFKEQLIKDLHSGDYLDYSIKANTILWDNKDSLDKEMFLMIVRNDPKYDYTKSYDNCMFEYKDGRKFLKTISLSGKGIIIEKIAEKKISAAEAKTTYTLDNKYAGRIIYWLDESRKSAEKNLTLLNENEGSFMLLQKAKFPKDSQEVLGNFVKDLKSLIKLGFEIIRYSEIEKTKIDRAKREKKGDSQTDIITGIYLRPGTRGYGIRQNLNITADKKSKTIVKASWDKINEVRITDGVYVIKVDKITDYKLENSIRKTFPKYVFALNYATKPVLILNEINLKKLKNYVTVETNIDSLLFDTEISNVLRAYVMNSEKEKIKRELSTLVTDGYYGNITLTDTSTEIISQIFDMEDSMKLNLKEITNIVSQPDYRLNYGESIVMNEILKNIRTDITTVNIDSDLKKIKEHIASVSKKKPLLKHLKHFITDEEALNEMKKYAYACDVLYL